MSKRTRLTELQKPAARHRHLLARAAIGLAVAGLLYLVSRTNYPLFHSIVDTVTVFIAGSVFLVVWNGRRRLDNGYYLFIAIAFLAFALLDFMHIVGNKDMGVFPEYGNLGPTFYIAGRYVLGVSFLLAPLFIKRKVNTVSVFAAYLLVVALVLLSVLYWRNFPATFIKGAGLTAFKVYSDYAVCLMLLGGLGLLLLNRRAFDERVLKTIALSLVFSIATGLAFTLYSDPFGITNAVGHFFQMASFYLVYLAFVETVLTKPQNILYRKLNSSEERLRMAQQAGGIGTFDWDYRSGLAHCSQEYFRVMGRESADRETVNFSEWSSWLHPEDRDRVLAELQRAAEGTGEAGCEYRVVNPSGESRWILFRGHILRDPERQPDRMLGAVLDITERKAAEEALRESEERSRRQLLELQSIYDSAHVGLCVLDRDLRFVRINHRFAEINGIPWADHIGKTVEQVVPNIAATVRDIADRIFRTGEGITDIEISGTTVSGSVLRTWVEQWLPLKDLGGSVVGINVVVEDITERKQDQEALREAKDSLEEKVRQRTAELSLRSDQLRALASELTLAEQRERRRLAEVLHDNLQQLLVGAKLRLTMLGRARDPAVKEVACAVQDLLDESIQCSRSLTGELSPPILHQGGLSPALHWLAAWMKQKYSFNVELETQADADPQTEEMKVLLFQSTRELLFNAVKHAKVDSARVRLSRSDGHIELSVSDNGAGFDPDAVSPQPGRAGGFGLFSIRERLDLLGGKLEIDSALDRGSRFKMRVPVETPSATVVRKHSTLADPHVSHVAVTAAEEAACASGAADRRLRVLLVDDHVVVRQGLASLLAEQPDIQVVGEASEGQRAVELVRQLQPDVVLMDFSMPDMDGAEATRHIHGEFPQVHIIGLSMFEEGQVAEKMQEAGAVAYLAKSGPSDALLAAIRACRGFRSVSGAVRKRR